MSRISLDGDLDVLAEAEAEAGDDSTGGSADSARLLDIAKRLRRSAADPEGVTAALEGAGEAAVKWHVQAGGCGVTEAEEEEEGGATHSS